MGLWGVSAALFLILPSSAGHSVPWGNPNAFGRREKPKARQFQGAGSVQSSPCMTGVFQRNSPLLSVLFIPAHLQEMWSNKSTLEHSKCISTWPVLRWRTVLHSYLTSKKSLLKHYDLFKGLVPSPFLSPIHNEAAIWLFAHSFKKAERWQVPTCKRWMWLFVPLLFWGWMCCQHCFELAACDYMCESPWQLFQAFFCFSSRTKSLAVGLEGDFSSYLLNIHTSHNICVFQTLYGEKNFEPQQTVLNWCSGFWYVLVLN